MTPYVYTKLPPGSITRMIRLLPQRERNAPIECTIVHYDLSVSESQNHLYEALSYTWGSNYKPKSIVIDDFPLPVTENLHTALLYLRDHQLERILWVDAICINQEDDNEKNTQIPLMRSIYAQADRVIVWLGEPDYGGNNALDTIHRLAETRSLLNLGTENIDLSDGDYHACMRLIGHDWFRRIWVLQEVGVARSIIFRCGLAQVNGYAFCGGLSRLKLSVLPEHVVPIIPLVRSSIVQPRNSQKFPGRLPIGELIDMYHTHFATVPHDKIYALLGLCSDNLETPCLRPNYQLAFSAVVSQVVNYVFTGNHTVTALPDTNIAVIKGKGWILGRIVSVESSGHLHDYQSIKIAFHQNPLAMAFKNGLGEEWLLNPSARPVRVYDIVCFLQQASKPTFVRLKKGQISVIVSMATPEMVKIFNGWASFRQQSGRKISEIQQQVENIYEPPIELILTWDIGQAHKESNGVSTTSIVPTSTMPKSIWQTSGEEEQVSRCQQVLIEDIFVNILSLSDFEGQFKPMKHLLCETLVKIPVSPRVLEAATARYDIAYGLLKLMLDGQRQNVSTRKAPFRDATSISELMDLRFSWMADSCVTERAVDAATRNQEGFSIIKLFNQHQKRLPISERIIQNAIKHKLGLSMVSLFYKHQGTLPISEEVINASLRRPRRIDFLELFFKHQKCPLISVATVQKALLARRGIEILRLLLQHSEGSANCEAVDTAVWYHRDRLRILRQLYHQNTNLPISKEAVDRAILDENCLENLVLLYKFHKKLPIDKAAVEFIATELVGPGYKGLRLLIFGNKDSVYEYRRKCLELIYQHQSDVVLQAAKDSIVKEKVLSMLRDIDVEETE